MTESAEQPLLDEQSGESKKPAKKRTTKPRTSAAKTAKPRAKKAAKRLPKQRFPRRSRNCRLRRRWFRPLPSQRPLRRPPRSGAHPRAESGAGTRRSPGATKRSDGAAAIRQRPVYIPRHCGQADGRASPARGRRPRTHTVALPAEEAARYVPAAEAPRMEVARVETPRVEAPPREEELGEAEGIVEVSGKGFGFLRDPKRGFAPASE